MILTMKLKIVIYTLHYIIATISYSQACSSRSITQSRPSSSSPTYLGSSLSVAAGSALPKKISSGITVSADSQTSTISPTTSTTTPRPNITFPTYKCPETYDAWYCLNDATCFSVKIGESIMYNCECATGYMGPRCEYKEIDGSYLPNRKRPILEKASIASGATFALLTMLFIILTLYLRNEYRNKTSEDDEDLFNQKYYYINDEGSGEYNLIVGDDAKNKNYYSYHDETKHCRYCNDTRCCGNSIGILKVGDTGFQRLRKHSNASGF